MAVSLLTETVYNSHFIPYELFLIIFAFALILFALSFIVPKGRVVIAAVSTVFMFFCTYATFYLGKTGETFATVVVTTNTTDVITTTINNLTTINTIFTVPALLYLLIGLSALCVANIWYCVADYSKDALDDAVEKNKEVRKDGMV